MMPGALLKRLVKDPKWLIGSLVVPAAAIAVPVLLERSAPATPTLTLGQLTTSPMTLGELMQSLDESTAGVPGRALHQPGIEASANFTAAGTDGVQMRVVCTVTDQRTLHYVVREHPVKATGRAETTQPCWLPLPGRARDNYTVKLALDDRLGNELRAVSAGQRGA